jgi:hypothetical protein
MAKHLNTNAINHRYTLEHAALNDGWIPEQHYRAALPALSDGYNRLQ